MTECCICYELIGKKNNCVTDCGHQFCFKCLAISMRRNNGCPICRAQLIDESETIAEVSDDDDEDDDYDDLSQDEDYTYEYVPDDHAHSSKNLARRFQEKNITYEDLVCLLFSRDKLENDNTNTVSYTHLTLPTKRIV